MKSKTLVVGLGIAALCSALALAQPGIEERAQSQSKQEWGSCDWFRGLQEGDCRPSDADYAICLKKALKDYETCVKKYGK